MHRPYSYKETGQTPPRTCLVTWGRPSFLRSMDQTGPSLRSTHFAIALLRGGADVLIACYHHSAERLLESGGIFEEELDGQRVSILDMGRSDLEEGTAGELIRSRFNPRCLVGATAYASAIAVRLDLDVPVWADIFGDVMAEAQAKSFRDRSDSVDPVYRQTLLPLLRTADRFSTVSQRQADALVGQLGLAGRLNAATAGEQLVATIPCAAEHWRENGQPTGPAATIDSLPADAFVVLWSGGFNTWCDIETLFEGLECAMTKNGKIHFVATGGAIPGHDEKTFPGFVELVEKSSWRDHFHLLGWISEDRLEAVLRRADVGVVIEHNLYERRLGSENRVTHWMTHGIPCITTGRSEMGQYLLDEGMAFGGDLDSGRLAELLLDLSNRPSQLKRAARLCRRFSRESLSYQLTAKSLVDWCLSPVVAGDKRRQVAIQAETYHLSPYAVFYPSVEGDSLVVIHAFYGSKFQVSAELFTVLTRMLQEQHLGELEEEYSGKLGTAVRTLLEEKILLPEDEFLRIRTDEFEDRLDPVALAFQRAVNDGTNIKQTEGRHPPKSFKEIAGDSSLSLQTRKDQAGSRSLLACLDRRRSIRMYSDQPMPLESLERFLSHTALVQAQCEIPGTGTFSIRNYPSGGARYPLEIYPLIANVAGFQPGVYHYQPFRHSLTPVNMDRKVGGAILKDACARLYGCKGKPAVLFIITAVFARTCRFYRGIPLHLILQEVGALSQTMYLVAADLDLAPCSIGVFPELAVDELLGLDHCNESQVGLFALGMRDEDQDPDLTVYQVRLRQGPPVPNGKEHCIELEFSNGFKQFVDLTDFRVDRTLDREWRCRVLRGRAFAGFSSVGRDSLMSLLEMHPDLRRTVFRQS